MNSQEIPQDAVASETPVVEPEVVEPTKAKKTRKSRTSYTPYQLEILEMTFNQTKCYPNNGVREMLATSFGMSENQIRVWFQNRRAKDKRLSRHAKDMMSHSWTEAERSTTDWTKSTTNDKAPLSNQSCTPSDPMANIQGPNQMFQHHQAFQFQPPQQLTNQSFPNAVPQTTLQSFDSPTAQKPADVFQRDVPANFFQSLFSQYNPSMPLQLPTSVAPESYNKTIAEPLNVEVQPKTESATDQNDYFHNLPSFQNYQPQQFPSQFSKNGLVQPTNQFPQFMNQQFMQNQFHGLNNFGLPPYVNNSQMNFFPTNGSAKQPGSPLDRRFGIAAPLNDQFTFMNNPQRSSLPDNQPSAGC